MVRGSVALWKSAAEGTLVESDLITKTYGMLSSELGMGPTFT